MNGPGVAGKSVDSMPIVAQTIRWRRSKLEAVMAREPRNSKETLVIYYSKEDRCWIAHSLKTDQIGTGDRIVDALADVLKAIHVIRDEALKDSSLAVYRDAPPEIQKMAKKAKQLPGEIFEVAHKMVHGDWPEDWNPPEPKEENDQPFKTEIAELACA
jgi:hypothetical protein